MTRKKQLLKALRCIIFLAIVLCSAISFSYVVRQVSYRIHRTMLPSFYAEASDSLDVVAIGSSACYRYVDTPVLYEKFGITSFNVATPLQPTSIVRYLMNEVEKTQKPQLYLVEVREFLRLKEEEKEQAVYCASDSMDFSPNKWFMDLRAYDNWAERLEAFFDITKYHGEWEGVSDASLAFWRNRVKNPSKEWDNIAKTEPQKEPEWTAKSAEDLYPHNEQALIELLEDCRKKNRQVLFFMTPYIYGEAIPGRLLRLKELVESYGYSLLDMSRGSAYGLDYDTDFYNTHHVNWRGAEKITLVLGDYIKKEYNIVAKHTQAIDDEWSGYASANRREADSLTGSEQADFDDSLEGR